MSNHFLELPQSSAAQGSGWKGTLGVYTRDDDGDVKVYMDNVGSLSAIYLDSDDQRALRDFLNDELGDAGGDDTVVAIEGLTDAIYDLSTALRDPRPAEIVNNFSTYLPPEIGGAVEHILSLLRKDR
jgi:hypothetical protein